MQRKSYDAVDVFKWICSFLIMYIHFAPVIIGAPGVDRIISQGVCRVAVPFFFAASAFFLFRKMGDSKTDARENGKKLLKFCGHILLMYTVWTVIYSLYYVVYNARNSLPQKPITEYVLGFFFAGGLQEHLWYLIATVYAMPIAYLLWRGGRKIIIVGIVVCELLCCLEWPYRFLPIFTSEEWSSILQHCTLPINALVNGVPLMSIGALCVIDSKKYDAKKWLKWLLVATTLYAAEVAGLYLYFGNEYAASGMITRGFFTYCLVNWLLTVNFKLPKKWMAKTLRLSSTWNYCAHMLVFMLFHWIFAYLGIKRFVIVACLTVISGMPYIACKLFWEKRRKAKEQRLEMRG